MSLEERLTRINAHIQGIRIQAEELQQLGKDFPALTCNAARLLASLKMLELNVCDIVDLKAEGPQPKG